MLIKLLTNVKDYGFLDVVNSRIDKSGKDARIGEERYNTYTDLSCSEGGALGLFFALENGSGKGKENWSNS